MDSLYFPCLPWPGGVAEPCSRHQEKGAHCLSVANLRAAGVGEPRKGPEGPQHGQHGFAHFAETKVGRLPGRTRSFTENPLDTVDIVLKPSNTPFTLTPTHRPSSERNAQERGISN